MKNVFLIISLLLILATTRAFTEDSIPVKISVGYLTDYQTSFTPEQWYNEWIHLRISNTLDDQILYDSLTTLKMVGFNDTVYLDSGTYKCEVLNIGAATKMPVITLDNGYVVPWGYPAYEYYLFSIPGGELTTYSSITDTACFMYTSPSSKYTWTESGIYSDTIPNAIGYDSIITLDLTIISINNTIEQSDSILTVIEPDADYQWLSCLTGINIEGAINQSYKPIVSGLYYVNITKAGCSSSSACYSMEVKEPDLNDLETSVTTYPNPFNDDLYISLGKAYNEVKIVVQDVNGTIVTNQLYSNQVIIELNVENYKSGIYYVVLTADNEQTVFKVIKQ